MLFKYKTIVSSLPVHVVPVYPAAHAHCVDTQSVLASALVQSEVVAHVIPTTAEKTV